MSGAIRVPACETAAKVLLRLVSVLYKTCTPLLLEMDTGIAQQSLKDGRTFCDLMWYILGTNIYYINKIELYHILLYFSILCRDEASVTTSVIYVR